MTKTGFFGHIFSRRKVNKNGIFVDFFSLPVGELTTEAGLISGYFAGFLPQPDLWIIIHKFPARQISALALALAEFSLNRQTDSDPVAAISSWV